MKRIFLISGILIIGAVAVVRCYTLYSQRTRSIAQDYKWTNGIGIRVEEYRVLRDDNSYSITGVVNIRNGEIREIDRHPDTRVLARDTEGGIHSLSREWDGVEYIREMVPVPVGRSFDLEFDGVLKSDNNLSEFAVIWEGDTNVVTDWVEL